MRVCDNIPHIEYSKNIKLYIPNATFLKYEYKK